MHIFKRKLVLRRPDIKNSIYNNFTEISTPVVIVLRLYCIPYSLQLPHATDIIHFRSYNTSPSENKIFLWRYLATGLNNLLSILKLFDCRHGILGIVLECFFFSRYTYLLHLREEYPTLLACKGIGFLHYNHSLSILLGIADFASCFRPQYVAENFGRLSRDVFSCL